MNIYIYCMTFLLCLFVCTIHSTLRTGMVLILSWGRGSRKNGMEQVVNLIPGSVGYISYPKFIELMITRVSSEVLWVYMAWYKNCVEKNFHNFYFTLIFKVNHCSNVFVAIVFEIPYFDNVGINTKIEYAECIQLDLRKVIQYYIHMTFMTLTTKRLII